MQRRRTAAFPSFPGHWHFVFLFCSYKSGMQFKERWISWASSLPHFSVAWSMARGKTGEASNGSNGLRGYKLLRLPMVAGSPITRTAGFRLMRNGDVVCDYPIWTWKIVCNIEKPSVFSWSFWLHFWRWRGRTVYVSCICSVITNVPGAPRTLLVKKHEARDPAEKESAPRTLFVTHLDTFATEAQLQKSFSSFGAVETLRQIIRVGKTQQLIPLPHWLG